MFLLVLIIALLISFTFLTYSLTTARFFQSPKNAAKGKRPPTIPYLAPGVFHSFSIAFEGPQKYFARLIKEYGSFAPFTVKAGFRTFVVLRDPQHIKVVAQALKIPERNSIVGYEYEEVFRSPKSNASSSTNASKPEKYDEKAKHARTASIHKYLTGASLSDLSELYALKLSSNMDDKMFQVGTWTQIEDCWSFFQQVLTRCIVETLVGSTFFRQYPKFIKEYWAFEDSLESYLPGVSGLLDSSAYEKPRDTLLEGLEKWIRANHAGNEFAKIGTFDPDWDEQRGSKFVQEFDSLFSEFSSEESRAVELLELIHCSTADIIPMTIWSMIEILRSPEAANKFTSIVSKHRSETTGTYGVADIAAEPFVKSMQHEVSRFRMAKYMMYPPKGHDILLDNEYTLPKGSAPIAFSHDVALNMFPWDKARGRVLDQPLVNFWAERFLVSNRQNKKGGEFSLEGLELLTPSFGGHQNLGLGREFAEAMPIATLAVLWNEFEIQLCDPEFTDAVMPPMLDVAFGTLKPQHTVAVRIRKRTVNRGR